MKNTSKYFSSVASNSTRKRVSSDKNIQVADLTPLPPKISKDGCIQGTSSKILPKTFEELHKFSFSANDLCSRNSAPTREFGKTTTEVSAENMEFPKEAFTNPEEDFEKNITNCSDLDKDDPHEKTKIFKYTPLEEQFLKFKKEYPDALLFIECGYKYRLFEDHAKIASKELNIGCYKKYNLYSSSIPTHRLAVHVRRLAYKGHKVGVIKQIETAAIKAAGDNKSSLFSRKLHSLYTSTTLIGEGFNFECSSQNSDYSSSEDNSNSGYIMCICDKSFKNAKQSWTSAGVLSVHPLAGDVYYAHFNNSLSDFESCLQQIDPDEIVLPKSKLNENIEKLVKSYSEVRRSKRCNLRIERLEDDSFDFCTALSTVESFCDEGNFEYEQISSAKYKPQDVLSLPPLVICCISALILYLKQFKLDSLLKNLRNFKHMSDASLYMNLNYITIRNLEILKNSTNHTKEGTLFDAINFTRTKFGERLLRRWLTKPLIDIGKIEERQYAVEELIHTSCSMWNYIEKMLSELPDLERLLCAAFYHKCTCSEFVTLLNNLVRIKEGMHEISGIVISSTNGQSVLKNSVIEISSLLETVHEYKEKIEESSAKEEDKTKIFKNESEYYHIMKCRKEIETVEQILDGLRPDICKALQLPSFNYSTVSGQKFLIEVNNCSLPLVPSDWINMSSTKHVSRFRSPEVETLLNRYHCLHEELIQHCKEAWSLFLNEFGNNYFSYKRALTLLAELDCFFCFAKLGKQSGFCRPIITNSSDRHVNIVEGRNLILSKIMGEQRQCVANDTKLNGNERCVIITGPNMGGKSSYVSQVALIIILAQTGCYVPSSFAELPLYDGIYIRKGSEDDLLGNKSTFMTEMTETKDTLFSATSKSLVILDELGRGTSTYDGAAIAHGVIDYLITEIKCTTLFVTHFAQVAEDLQKTYPDYVITWNLAFHVDSDAQSADIDDITFLYNINNGVSTNSYGINVARLVGIPLEILSRAKRKSFEFEKCSKRTMKKM